MVWVWKGSHVRANACCVGGLQVKYVVRSQRHGSEKGKYVCTGLTITQPCAHADASGRRTAEHNTSEYLNVLSFPGVNKARVASLIVWLLHNLETKSFSSGPLQFRDKLRGYGAYH